MSISGAPEGIRTPNRLIRSQVLYPLSYRRKASKMTARVVHSLPQAMRARQRRMWPLASHPFLTLH